MSYDSSDRFSNWQTGGASTSTVEVEPVTPNYDADPFGMTGTVKYDINNNPVDKKAVEQKLASRPVASAVGNSPVVSMIDEAIAFADQTKAMARAAQAELDANCDRLTQLANNALNKYPTL